jgi:hypothetical protein
LLALLNYKFDIKETLKKKKQGLNFKKKEKHPKERKKMVKWG